MEGTRRAGPFVRLQEVCRAQNWLTAAQAPASSIGRETAWGRGRQLAQSSLAQLRHPSSARFGLEGPGHVLLPCAIIPQHVARRLAPSRCSDICCGALASLHDLSPALRPLRGRDDLQQGVKSGTGEKWHRERRRCRCRAVAARAGCRCSRHRQQFMTPGPGENER